MFIVVGDHGYQLVVKVPAGATHLKVKDNSYNYLGKFTNADRIQHVANMWAVEPHQRMYLNLSYERYCHITCSCIIGAPTSIFFCSPSFIPVPFLLTATCTLLLIAFSAVRRPRHVSHQWPLPPGLTWRVFLRRNYFHVQPREYGGENRGSWTNKQRHLCQGQCCHSMSHH